MPSILRTLLTTSLCVVIGAFAGRWKSAPELENSPEPTARRESQVSKVALLTPNPPPFTSVTASVDWVRAQLEKGDATAAERLFRKEAGLTDEQRMGLASALAQQFRRMDPRVLARIILGLPRGPQSDHLFWRLIADWCSYDAEDALRFIELLPADRLNTVGVLHNAASICCLPADRVLAFASRLDDKGRSYLAEGLVGLADQFGSWRNTSAILDQLNVKPQEDAISPEWFLGRQLAEIDPQALESRIAAETDPLKHDKLMEGYASHIGRFDPVHQLAVLAQMHHPEPKPITDLVERWLTRDRTAALDWLQGDAARQSMDREARLRLLRLYQREAAP